jgi:hypothetical protein
MKRHPNSLCPLWQKQYRAGRAFDLLHSQGYWPYHHMRVCYVWTAYFHQELHNHLVQCNKLDSHLRVSPM